MTYSQGDTFRGRYLETRTTTASVGMLLMQESTGDFLDWSDTTFKAAGLITAGNEIRALSEVVLPNTTLSVWRDATGYVLPTVDAAYLPTYKPDNGAHVEGERIDVRSGASGGLTAQQIADAVWNELQAGHTVANSFGSFLNTAISSRLATSGYTAPDNATIAAIPVTLTSMMGVTFVTGTDSLEAIRNQGDAAWTAGAGGGLTAQQVRDAMDLTGPFNAPPITTYLADIRNTTNGFLFKQEDGFSPHYLQVVLADNVTHGGPNCALSASQMVLGISAPTNNTQWDGTPLLIEGGPNAPGVRIFGDALFNQPAIDLAGGGSAPGLAGTIADLASVAAIVWNGTTAAYQTVGSTGKALTDAQSAGDPLASTVPGAYAAGTAGNLIGNLLDAAVSSRQPSGAVDLNADQSGVTVGTTTALTNAVNLAAGQVVASVTGAVGSVTSPVTVTGGGSLTASERTAIADALLDRDMSTGTDTGSNTKRTVRQALRMNRNKVAISGGTLTVSKEDDITASHTAVVTTAAGDPIVSLDPA